MCEEERTSACACMYATAQTQKWVRIKEPRIWLYGGIGKMVSKRAAHLHAPETCAPILNSRIKGLCNGFTGAVAHTVIETGIGTIQRGSRQSEAGSLKSRKSLHLLSWTWRTGAPNATFAFMPKIGNEPINSFYIQHFTVK